MGQFAYPAGGEQTPKLTFPTEFAQFLLASLTTTR